MDKDDAWRADFFRFKGLLNTELIGWSAMIQALREAARGEPVDFVFFWERVTDEPGDSCNMNQYDIPSDFGCGEFAILRAHDLWPSGNHDHSGSLIGKYHSVNLNIQGACWEWEVSSWSTAGVTSLESPVLFWAPADCWFLLSCKPSFWS